MTYLLTLADYSPGARTDGVPWTKARIEESGSRTGQYTTLSTVTLSPVDTDPAAPRPRTFTVSGSQQSGWYRVTWLDVAGNQQPTVPVFNSPYRPTVDDVAALIPARARDSGGSSDYTFTDPDDQAGDPGTSPPARIVEKLIQDSAARVFARVGDIPDILDEDARGVIALRTAMVIERGADDFNQTRFEALSSDFDAALVDLVKSIEDVEGGGEPGDSAEGALPVGTFPPACPDPGNGWYDPETQTVNWTWGW